MPRKAPNLYSLARGHVRALMNKYNLFNLYKKAPLDHLRTTLYQQKWRSKAETRAYHGEHLTELRWKATFEPNLRSVAQLDLIEKIERGVKIPPTPLQLQTYAVLEKRLDFALFRALFASSIRQARQYILHGNVRVNGVVIKSPGYTLKPGDVFSCEPEKVLAALGRGKPSLKESGRITQTQIAKWNIHVRKVLAEKELGEKHVQAYVRGLTESDRVALVNKFQKSMSSAGETIILDALRIGAEAQAKSENEITNAVYQNKYGLREDVNSKLLKIFNIVVAEKFGKSAENVTKLDSKELAKKVSEFISEKDSHMRMVKRLSLEIVRSLTDTKSKNFEQSMNSLEVPPELKKKILKDFSKLRHQALDLSSLTEETESSISVNLPFQKHLFGRKDVSKPYFTPWEPRPFLAPFAILPHHLEVSFSTCHAVYLRDPIARPGGSEVISPFDLGTHERAFMFYIRKGK